MAYLIDGHNLVPHIANLELHDVDDELQLVKILQEFCTIRQQRAEVFFDNAPAGQAGQQSFGLVTAQFVRRGSSADNAIRRRLSKLGKVARNWTVVSSDREVQRAAKAAGARVIGSQDFASHLATIHASRDPETLSDVPLSADEVDAWMRIFGEEEE